MQSAQEVYNSTVSHWPPDEQLRLASLILSGITQTKCEKPTNEPRRSVLEILKEAPGGRIFKTSAEADAYLREERDSWER